MDKYISEGKVAILIPNRHGAQWYTNHKVKELIFDRHIVNLVLDMQKSIHPFHIALDIEKYCDLKYGERPYYGDTMYLDVEWVSQGTKFSILFDEDGWEVITKPYKEIFEA